MSTELKGLEHIKELGRGCLNVRLESDYNKLHLEA